MDFRKMSFWVTVILVWVGLVACGSDSSSTITSAISDNPSERVIKAGLEPTLISTTSVNTDAVATDGKWLAWTGVDRQGIYVSNGLETRNQTENLAAEYYPKEIAFDGRYTAFITESQKQLFIVDNQDAESNPVLIADSSDRFEEPCLNQGELVWIDNADDILYYVDLNAGSYTPVAITDGANRKIQAKINNGLIVWCESIFTGADTHWRIFYYDLKSVTPTIVQPSGQTNYDHWMANVHDQFIVWQGSDAGLDVEIFYCDLRQDPLVSVQLTNNTADDRHPQVENKIIVWDGSIGFESTISYMDMKDANPSIHQLSTQSALYDRLSHFKDNVIAWIASSGSFYQIYYYDLNDSSPSIVQLTNDSFHNMQPQVDNGQIVWRTQEAESCQILAHRLVSSLTDQVANLPYSEISSLLSENAHHVWLSKGLNRRVYAQQADGETLEPIAVTSADLDVDSLNLDEGMVVLRAFDGASFHVYSCDLNADTYPLAKLSDDNNTNGVPLIEGNIVVWEGENAGGVDQVFYADLASASPAGVAIAVEGEFNHQCSVDDGMITWLGGISPNYEVYYYDTNASSPLAINLTDNAIWETEPKLGQGIVAWSRQNTGNINDVWYYDLCADTPKEVQVTNSAVSDDRIKTISDRVLVWISDNLDIFYYDLNANSTAPVQVTTDAEWKGNLSLDHGKLVWNVDGEIYGYDIYNSDPTQIRITDNQINDRNPKTKDELIIWEGNELAYAVRW